MNRRDFLAGTALAGATLAAGSKTWAKETGSAPSKGWKKAVVYSMLPGDLPWPDRFKLLKDCGFDGLEASPEPDLKKAEQMREWAERAGIEIHSVMFGGWHAPLSSGDEALAQRGEDELKTCLRSAKAMGATSVLLVPAVVNAQTRYVDAYTRSQKRIRRVAPLAAELKVPILIEEVWNNFLLSPLEFAKYVDEFRSPWVQAYFDVGNVVAFAWPEDWIRTLGKRIKRVHLKDFKRGPREFVNLRDGDVDWPEVMKAFREIGFSGWVTAELGGGDAAYLKDVAARIDTILKG
jgi:L-ribulose-5-phosphate 3-epimerase